MADVTLSHLELIPGTVAMATGVHIQEPVLDTLRREGDENEKMMDQASNIILGKIPVEGNIGARLAPIEAPDTLETEFEVKDSVKGNEGSASTIDGEKFLKSPSAEEVYFEENNLAPDASQVTGNEKKMATEQETEVGEAKLDAEESNGLEKGLVSALEVAATREAGHDESIPVHETGLSDNKDRESTIPEKEAAHLESLNVNPEDTKTCVTVNDTEITSSVEEKSMTSTSQEIPGEKIEQTTFDANQETPENISTVVPNEETEQNLSIELDDSQMKTDENLEKEEDEKPESTLVPEGKIKDEESTQNELFETKNDTETVIQKCEEVIEKGVESSPVSASEAEDIKESTSDDDTKTSALENQIRTENPQEIEVEKSECKPEKETPKEQVEDVATLASMTSEDDSLTKHEAHLEKESEKPCFTNASTMDASHNETTPVDKVKTEDEEPSKSDLFENKEDTESTILMEEPIMEKHLESLNATSDDIKACGLLQDTETKSSTEEKLPTATPQEIWGDKIEQTSFDTKEETPEDISTNVSNEKTEQNSIVEVSFITEALTADNVLATTEGKIKDEDQREKGLLENKNDTESELLKQEVTEKPVESLQLADEAVDTKVSTSDQHTQISALENQILTENPQEIVADETESKPCDAVDTKKETLDVQDVSTIESNDAYEENSVIEEDESEKPLLREESTRDAAGDESTYTHEDKTEGKDQRRAELIENPDSSESMSLTEDNTIWKLVESPQVDAEDIQTHVLDQGAETTGLILASEGNSNDGKSAVKYEVKIEDDDQKEDQLCDSEKNLESDVLLEAAQIETPIESFQKTLPSTVPQGFLDDKTEGKTVDAIQKDEEILDIKDVSTIESNADNKENSVVEEDESEKPLFKEESTRDAAGDESTYTHEDKAEGKDQRRAELFENPDSVERMSLIEDNTILKLVESPQVNAKDIKTRVFDQDSKTTGLILASEGNSNDGESAVKYEIRTEDDDQKDDQLCDNEKNPERSVLLEAAKIETPIESLQETLPIAVPQRFLEDKTEEKTVDAIQKDKDILDEHNVTKTVSNEKIEKKSSIQMDASQIQHGESLEKEHEITSLIGASTKHGNDDELIITDEYTIEHEDLRKFDLLESKKDRENNLQKNEAQIETRITPLEVAAGEITSSDSHQGTKTTNSKEKRILNENEIMHEQTNVERVDTTHTKKETPEALHDVSTIVLNDDHGENSALGEDESQMKNEENLGEKIKKPSLIEESRTYASGDESTNKREDKSDDEEQTRAESLEDKRDTKSTLLKEEETSAQPLESPQVDVEDIKKNVPDQGTETTGLVVLEGVANDDEPEIKRTEDKYQKKIELCDTENIPDSALLLEAAQMEKPFESSKEALTTLVPQGFLDENIEENAITFVSKENIEDDSLLQVDDSQIQCNEYPEEESQITSIIEASTKNINDDISVQIHEDSDDHEDLRKDEFGDTKINSLQEEAQVEMPDKSSNIAAEDIIASSSCQETETSSQEKRTLNEEETVCEQIDVETLNTTDTKTQTSEAQDVSTIVPNDDSGQISVTEENDLQMKNEGTFGKETEKPSVTEASMTDSSGDDSANHCEDKVEGVEQTGAELFEDKKDMESKLIKEEVMARLVESPQVDTEDIKTYVSDEGAETTGMVEASEGHADDESAVKNEVQTEDDDKKEDELSDNEKNPESGELLETTQTENSIEPFQETLPCTIPRGFLDDNTEEKIVDAIQKDEDVQNPTTVSNEKIEENSVIQMDGSQIQNEEYLEKEHEITPVIEAWTKHANDDELIVHEDNIENEDLRKVELLESDKDTEINLQEDEAQIKTHIKSSPAEDIIASDSYQGTETTYSQEERILNENEIMHEETEVEKLDAADTKKETPEALDVSTIGLNDDNEENLVIAENDSEMKNEENLGKESENPSFIEASPMDASGDESTKKCEDKIEGEEQTRAEDTESKLLKEAETAAQPLESPQVDAEDVKTYVSDQGTETTCLVEVFEEVANDNQPEVKCTIKTEDKDQEEDELCDNEKIPDKTLHLEVEEMEKPFESFKEALPTLVPRGFLDEKTEEKITDATEKDEETHEIQNVTVIVSNENIEDDSLLQVDGSQTQGKECSEEESERTPIIEASTKNVNDDYSINVHEDSAELESLRNNELVETNEDRKITSQKEKAQLETAVKSLPIAAEDKIESDSCQETGTTSSQEERILNEEEIVREQIEVETLDTADTKTKTPEAQDVSTIVPNDVSEANSATGENEENLGKESRKLSVIEASLMDASADESTNTCENKIEGEEQTRAEMFVDKKDKENTLLKEEEIMVILVESSHANTENTKTYALDEGAETTDVVEALEEDADYEKSVVKYEVKTEDNDQKEKELCDNEKNFESGVLLEAAQIEKAIESLQETLPSTVPLEFLNDKAEEKTMDAIEKAKDILDIQNAAKTVSNKKIEGNSLIQADSSQIHHQEYLEKEIEIPSVIEASTKHADDDELTSIHEDNTEHRNLRKVELLESKEDTEFNLQKDEVQMETPVNSLQVAAEDIIASDSYDGTEPTSQEDKLLTENEIVCEQTEVERLDTADSDKETPEAHNFATILPSENINENSRIPENGSELKHKELFEKENKAPPLSKTLTMEANDQMPEIIHQDKNEDGKQEKVDKFECDKHEEVTLLNEEAPAEKLNESSKEDLDDIKNIVPGENTIERSLIEVQSLNENPREIVGNHMEDNIADKDPEEIEDEHLNKDVMFENETHTEIGFIKEDAVKKFQEPEKKDLREIKAFVSHEGTETTKSIEERDLTEISQESVGDLSEDKIQAKAKEIPDFTPIVSYEHAQKNSSIHADGSQMKHENLLEKECEMLSPETSFLYSSSNEPTTIDVENIENEHLNKVDEFEDEKHTKIAIINYQAPAEEPLLEEVKAFVSWEGAETSSIEEQGLTETSQEIMGDQSEEKILDKVGMTQEFTKFVSDENDEDISLMLVNESQIKREELLEKESETSPLSETSLQNSNFNEPTILHQDKNEDELLIRVDKFESEKHEEISLIKEETPLEKLNESSLRKDLEEIKAFDLSEATETSSTGERNLTAVPQENDFTTVVASQIKHELLERESEAPPFQLLHSSDGKPVIVHTGKIEGEVLEKADKFECMESGEATLLSEEASAEKLTESSKDLEGIKESITCDGAEITSSAEEQNLTISQENVDDQVEEKVPDVAGEASDFTSIPDNTTEINLLVEVDASQMKHEEHLKKEREIPSLLMLNTKTEEPKIVPENKITEHTEIILSNEEALKNSSKEENENIKASVLCEDTETSCTEQESLIANSNEIVGDQVKEKIIDMAQNASDLTTNTSDEIAEEKSLIPSDGSQIKHEEHQEKESETPSTSMLDTVIEESTILRDRICEKDAEATLLKKPTTAEKVTESAKDDLDDTTVFLSCEDKEITSSIEEPSQKANQQEIVVDQTQENILDSATKAHDFKQTVSHENAENSLIQVDESQVKHEIMRDQTQENVLDTAPKDQDFKPAILHENAEEYALIQVDELQMKHDELGKESDTASLLIVDTSNEESRIIHEDITEDESLKKMHDFEGEKHEEITSTEEETQVTKVNESSKEDLEDIKALVSGEDSETTSFEEKQSLKESPREILRDQQEEKVLDIAPEAQNFIKVVSNENVEKDSMVHEDGSKIVHEEILGKEGETPSLSASLILNTTSEESKVIHENEIENEDTREVNIFECEKHVDGKILDAALEASESKIIVLDENTEEKTSNQVDKSQTKHEELLEKESKTLSLSETTLLNTSNEDSATINDDKIEDEDPEKVDKLECEKHAEVPLTKEEEPVQKLNNPSKEDMGDQMEENIIDTSPEPQNFTTLVSEENTKENLSLDVDESQIKHEELSEIESEKPSLSVLKTSNEESSFIRDSKTENEDVKRDEKVEQLSNFPEEGPENIKVYVPSENLETTSHIEERSLTENLTKDKILDLVPEALELKTIVSDKNIEENSFILEDGSQMKHEEHSEKDSEMPSLTETSILNTGYEEPTLFLDDKIEDEDQAKVNKSESEKHAEITDILVEQESEMPSLTETSIPSSRNEETKLFPDDKIDEEDQAKVNKSESEKHAEITEVPVEKESEMPSLTETSIDSILSPRNEEPTLFLDEKIEDEDQAKVHKSESEKHAEITEVPVENPNSSNLENIEAFVSCEDIEPTNSTEEQSPTVNPIENVGGQNVEKVHDKALEAPDFTPIVSNDNNDDNPSIQVDGSQMKHEEPFEKESNNVLSLLETSLLNTNNEEPETIHKDKIEDEALKNVDEFESKNSEINKLKEEAQVEESVTSKDIKAYVSYQDTEASAFQEQIPTANPQDILGNQSEVNVIDTTDSKEKITENLTVSNENFVKDSLTQIDESEIKHAVILEKEPYLAKNSALGANKESTTIHEDMIEEESGKIIESTLLNEGSEADEFVDSLQVISEDIKAPVSCQKTDTTTSNLNADPQEIAGDQTDDKITAAGTTELTLEALNLTTLVSNENEVLDSITPQVGLEIEQEETSLLADNKESIIIHVSCQDRDPTSSFEEQILTNTTQIVGDQVEEKVTDTAKTWEETLEVSSSILVFQEDESNRIGVDDITSVMIKDEETLNSCTASNAAENDEICSSYKVQAKEEEMEIISKTAIDEEDRDDTRIELSDDETNKTYIEEKEIDVSSHGKDTSEITRHDGAKDIPKGNENSTAKNEFLEDGYSNGSTESTTPIVSEDVEQIDKDIKPETAITETGAASSALPITGVQCGPEENESEDSKAKEPEMSLAPEGREYQGQHTKLHESPSPPLPNAKDSEWEMAQERGGDDLQSGDDTNDDMKELDEGSVAISDEGNLLEANSNENIETEVTAGEKEASASQHNPVSEFVLQEIHEQPGKTVEALPEEKGVKSEQGEINFDDSDDLKINSSTMVTDKAAPSDILCSFTADAGQIAVGQETQNVVQEKEQKPGKENTVEAVPEEKGINIEEDEIKEPSFNVLKENSPTVALDKVTPVNILQGSTTDAALRATDEETPEQHGLDEASLKEIEGGRASAMDKLAVLRADQIDNADSSLGSNKIPVLQHGDSSESSHTEGEKQKASVPEKGGKRGNEETAKLIETSESTEMDKPSLSGLLQEPMKEISKVVDHPIDKKEPTTKEEESQAEKSAEVEHVEEKTNEEKDDEEESCVHQISDLSSDTPVMVDVVDKDVKVAHKKSHGILSGVGSKVKHSISKVKKAITGKSSHPKSASPKYSEKF